MGLGPWESRLRQLIFDNASDYNPAFHIFRQPLVSGKVEQKEVFIPSLSHSNASSTRVAILFGRPVMGAFPQ